MKIERRHTQSGSVGRRVFLTSGLGEPHFQNPRWKTVPANVLMKRVRLVQDPAACDPAPRERSFLFEPGRWTEQKVGEAWEDLSQVMGLLLMEHGSGGGGVGVGGAKP